MQFGSHKNAKRQLINRLSITGHSALNISKYDLQIIDSCRLYRHIEENNFYLMGTMLEKSRRKRKIWRYQRPAKCCRATMTRDTTTRAPNRILVRQFTSRSNRPICNSTSHAVGVWHRFQSFGLGLNFCWLLILPCVLGWRCSLHCAALYRCKSPPQPRCLGLENKTCLRII